MPAPLGVEEGIYEGLGDTYFNKIYLFFVVARKRVQSLGGARTKFHFEMTAGHEQC